MQEITRPEDIAVASDDFGRIIARTPRAVLRPETTQDVVDVVHRARREKTPLATRGSAHSQSGQSLSDGLVLDMTSLNRIGSIDAHALTVRAQAGVVWGDLLSALAPHALTPPVLTNNLGVTIGGTLSMAGLGVASFRHGAQVDNVLSLEVVTGTGDVVRCSADENAELFDLVRCGLGQFGVITDATLRVREHQPCVRTLYLLYDNLARAVADAETLMREDRCDDIESWCVPAPQGFRGTPQGRQPFARWFFPMHVSRECASDTSAHDAEMLRGLAPYEVVHAETVSYGEFARRLEPLFALWKAGGYWANAHPWMETVLPWPAVVPFLTRVLDALPPHILGGGHVLLWPSRGTTSRAPNFMQPGGEFVMGFGLLPGVPRAALPAVLPLLDQLSDASIHAGGKRYLSGRIAFDAARWRAHFGARWDALCDAKKRYDPDGVLNPGFIAWE